MAPVNDHIPAVLQLLPSGPGVMGPGLPKLKLSMQSDGYCRGQLAAWLEEQLTACPEDQHAAVQWWPSFERMLRLKVSDLNQVARQRKTAAEGLTSRGAAKAALQAAKEKVDAASSAALPAAIDALMAARTTWAQILTAEENLAKQRRKQQWVHSGERPSPVMTARLRPPAAANIIAGLRAPGSGHLVVDGVSMASIVGRRHAEISTAPQVQQQAQQVVQQAMRIASVCQLVKQQNWEQHR